jgi:hypothetical protein
LRSKAQYELHFKKWEFRKNRTKDDWKIVAQKIGKRKREHKESEVYIGGNLIESKKVKKAISRYGSTSATTEMQLQGKSYPRHFKPQILTMETAPSPRTPEGIIIRTPLPTRATIAPVGSLPSPAYSMPTPANAEPILIDYLPFIQFNSMFSLEGMLDQ